jgi:hypothetical protein
MGMGRATAKRPEAKGFEKDDRGAPRHISLPMEEKRTDAAASEEASLTPEQVLARKIEELRKRFGRPE